MSERPRLSQLATEMLAHEPLPNVPPPSPTARARTLSILALEVRAQVAQRRRRRILAGVTGLVAAAAIVVVGLVALHEHRAPEVRTAWARTMHGEAHVVRAGASLPIDAQPLAPADHVVTGEGAKAAVTLSTGTRVTAFEATDVALVEDDSTQIFSLEKGRVTLDVAKLVGGERFLVRTVDAEIEVRGTSFTVTVVPADPSCGGGLHTRLDVAEGVVVIRAAGHEERVAAGDHFPRDCVASKDQAPAPIVDPALAMATTSPKNAATDDPPSTTTNAPLVPFAPNVLAPPTAPLGNGATGATTPMPTPTPTPVSLLAAQNDLFALATAAKQRGDTAGALAGYERFLAKYPDAPLAESATVERMRLLAKTSKASGAAAARAYLARYPQGFARLEAEKLASVP